MSTAMEAFADFLKRGRLKMTPQRQVILEVFLEGQGHPSAEELYDQVRRRDESIGQATVYRTVKLLEGAGLAKAVNFGDGVTRYEPKYGQAHHDHLICDRCHRNIEVVDEDIERLQEELAARHGFLLTGHKMYLYGVCAECRKAG